jgi:hypothetical protein
MSSRCRSSPPFTLQLVPSSARDLACDFNLALTIEYLRSVNIFAMPQDALLSISDRPGTRPELRVLELSGPLVLTTMFEFQSLVRADKSQALVIDFTNVLMQIRLESERWWERM